MKFAICNETWQGESFEAACRGAADAGYSAIEIAPFTLAESVTTLSKDERAKVRETARRCGLDIVGLHWLLVSPKGLSVTGDDPAVRSATSRYLVELTRLCGELGGGVMVLGSPAQRRLPEGGAADVASSRLLECLTPALAEAAARGVTICLEPLPAPEADFVLTLAEAVAIIEQAAHPALKTILDVKSASAESIAIADLIRKYAPWIAHVHANDSNRRGPGFGETQFAPIMAALREIGYAGYVSVEVFDYSPDPNTIAVQSLRHLKASPPAGDA